MNKDDILLVRRFEELSERAYARGRPFATDFLNLYEQSLLQRAKLVCDYVLDGGYDLAERKSAVFGGDHAPVTSVFIEPVMQKFADDLSHRDFLGSLMGLGIKREVLGDIIVRDNCAWLFCMESVSDYVTEQLVKVRRTDVKCRKERAHDLSTASLETRQYIAASNRADALVSSVFNLSRNRGQELIRQQKVFINGRLLDSDSDKVEDGAVVSVRGMGRFIFDGFVSETRKGRMRFEARLFR